MTLYKRKSLCDSLGAHEANDFVDEALQIFVRFGFRTADTKKKGTPYE